MKPIQTTYKGCCFRSRLEARWAVFFDRLGLIWEYEKEGYELPGGGRYLPDFWLPELDCYFEIKGSSPTDAEKNKALRLSVGAKKLVVLAHGSMSVEELRLGSQHLGEWPTKGFSIELFAGEAHHMWEPKSFGFPLWNWAFETDLPPFLREVFPEESIPAEDTETRRRLLVELDRKYYFAKHGREHPRYQWGRHQENVSWVQNSSGEYGFAHEPDNGITPVSAAYNAARSARFEFGEGG